MYAVNFQLIIYPNEDWRRDNNGLENGNLKRMAGSKLVMTYELKGTWAPL